MLYIGLTLLLGFGAVNTGNNLLYLLVSALLGFMAVSGVLGRTNLARLEISYRLPDEAYVGLPTSIGLKLRNRHRRLPVFLLEADFGDKNTLLPLIPAGKEACAELPLTFPRRGEQPLPRLHLSSGYPINFFIRTIGLPSEDRVLVFPAPRPAALPLASDGRSQLVHDRQTRPGAEGDLHSINDYRGDEPLKSIHWKLSARHPELKVKQLSSPVGEPVIIDPSAFNGTLEERLGQACHLVQNLIRHNRPVGLRLPQRQILPATGRRHKLLLLSELARL